MKKYTNSTHERMHDYHCAMETEIELLDEISRKLGSNIQFTFHIDAYNKELNDFEGRYVMDTRTNVQNQLEKLIIDCAYGKETILPEISNKLMKDASNVLREYITIKNKRTNK